MVGPGLSIMLRLDFRLCGLSGGSLRMGLSISYCLFMIGKMFVKEMDAYGHEDKDNESTDNGSGQFGVVISGADWRGPSLGCQHFYAV